MLIPIFFLLHTCSDCHMYNGSIKLHKSSRRIYLNIFIDNSFCISSFLCSLIISICMLLLQIKEN